MQIKKYYANRIEKEFIAQIKESKPLEPYIGFNDTKEIEDRINEDLSKIGKKSLTIPMGKVEITRPVKSLTIILRTCASVNMLTQSKKRLFDASMIILMALLLVIANNCNVLSEYAHFGVIPLAAFYLLGQYSEKKCK